MIKAIKEFEELHKDNAYFTEKAATKCKQILYQFFVAEEDDDVDSIP